MATFYTGVDKSIYEGGDKYVPMEQFRLNPYEQKNLSYDSQLPPQSFGITNTNAFTNSARSFNPSGNVFGYGTAIKPVAYGQYGAPGYEGGLPGNIQQYGVGRQFEDPSASPTGETYSYKKEVPGWVRAAATFIPGGNFGLDFIENQIMNKNRGVLSGYKMGGLDEIEKGAYNQLAGEGMLFEGPSGLKTLTGKNFGAKGYFEGQEELAKGFGFDQMTDAEIQEAIDEEGKRHSAIHKGNLGFKYKQMIEAAKMRNYKQEKDKQADIELQKEIDEANYLAANKAIADKMKYDNENTPTATGGMTYNEIVDNMVQDRSEERRGRPGGIGGKELMATGGRVGFKTGGKGRQDPMGGHAHQTAAEMRAAAPDQFGGGMSIGQGGGDNQGTKKLTVSPVIDRKWNSIVPTGVFGFDALTPFGKLKATANLKNYIRGDDVEPTLDYQGNIGPVDINATYSDDVQNINATINNNNWNAGINYDAITGEPTFGINYYKTFKHGGIASIL